MALYVKTVGEAGNPIPANWMLGRQDLLRLVRFPKNKRPSVKRGDLLLYYASGKRCFCAVMEVISDEAYISKESSEPEVNERWPWVVDLRPHLIIPADEHAPTLEQLDFDPKRLRQQSHVRVTQEEYDAIVQAIAQAGSRSASLAAAP